MKNKFEKILIATGGTGGHIFPAYSLAKHFLSKQKIVEIISDTRGIKFLKDFTDIKINEIQTFTVDKKNFFKTIYSLILIFISIFKSIFFLFKNKPDLVFGMGGYSSFPVCIASRILNIPFIVYENNLHIGKANKSLIPFAKKIFVSNSELQGIKEKYNYKICKIGNIIRHEILNYRSKIEYDNKKINFLVLGGSQAAKSFAEKLPKVFEKCKIENIPIKIYQQCLADQKEVLISKYRDLGIECEIFNFTTNILKYFSKTNLAITRSGSSMLAELLNANIPFIAVPLPTSADDHQLKNAIYYEKMGYSFLIEEKKLDDELFTLIKSIYLESSKLDRIKVKQSQYSDKKVFENIDYEIKDLIHEKN